MALSPHISRLERRLRDGIEALKLSLPEPAVPQLLAYLEALEQWNSAYNLTAIRDPQQMITRHLLDSLALLPYVQGDRIIDVGAGAGLPGLVLAIARPELAVTTLDSNGKKARFMRHAVRSLGLANATVVESRAEAFEPDELFDQVLSRAFASLADFVTGTHELLAPGGQWVAMKGKLESAELSALPPGYRIDATHRLLVPGLSEDRHAVLLTAT